MKTILRLAAGIAAAMMAGGAAEAAPVYEFFDELPAADFGGSGIPNDPVAWTDLDLGGGIEITLGLGASQRYDNPPLTNDGAGTYYATPGSSIEGPNNLLGALWNFNYYVDIAGATFADYNIVLRYDVDASGEDFGELNLSNYVLFGGPAQDSQNLMFSGFYTDVPGFLDAPSGAFDPLALGIYSFELIAFDLLGAELGRVAMNVEVVPVPVPPAAGLGLLGLAAVGILRRRSRSEVPAS